MVNRVIKEGFPKASLEAHSRFWPTRASAARHQIAFPVSQDGSNPSRHCPPPHAPQTEAEINDAQEGRGQRSLAAEQFCAFKPFIQYPECHPARQRVSGTGDPDMAEQRIVFATLLKKRRTNGSTKTPE